MQKKITFVGLTHNSLGFNMTFNMKYYVVDDQSPADIDIDKSVIVKGNVDGMTPDQVVNRELPKLAELFQVEINDFKKVKAALIAVTFADKESLLEGALNG